MSRSDFRRHIAENAGALPAPSRPAPVATRFRPGDAAAPPAPPSATGPTTPPAPTSTQTLPEFKRASAIVPGHIVKPPIVIEDVLHRGCKLVLAAPSKSFKSWLVIQLANAIATGGKFLGKQCTRGRVLYLNFELIDGFFEERIVAVTRAMHTPLSENFLYWNLRGHCYDLAILAQVILARLETEGPFDFIIVDPVYKALGDLDENKASDMTKLMNLVESIAVQTGSSIGFVAHFAKGSAAHKDSQDRPSGSGVIGRDPDAILTLTRHKEEHCYVVESDLRYVAPLSPFCVRWSFPMLLPDESLDPRELRQPGNAQQERAGAPAGVSRTEAEVLSCLPEGGAIDELWRRMVALRYGSASRDYYMHKATLIRQGLVRKDGNRYFPTRLRLESPPPPPPA